MENKKKRKVSFATIGYAFREIILPRKYLVLLGLFLIIINRLSGLVLPGSSKYLIDEVIAKGDQNLLMILILIVSISVAVSAVSSFFLTRLFSVEAQHLISQLRAQVHRHIIRLPISYFDNLKSRYGE